MLSCDVCSNGVTCGDTECDPVCPGLKDYSPEELRWEACQAQRQGSVERYVSEGGVGRMKWEGRVLRMGEAKYS